MSLNKSRENVKREGLIQNVCKHSQLQLKTLNDTVELWTSGADLAIKKKSGEEGGPGGSS